MLFALLKTMRPRQWTKNVLIFGALVFDQKLFDLPSFANTLAGFGVLCLVSGTVYIINDLVDVDKDRVHPQKKFRPIASGALNQQIAGVATVLFPLLLLPLSFGLGLGFGLLMTLYFLLQLAYSFKLKHIVIVDVMAIAAGFVIRVGAGVTLIDVTRFSPWLYLVITLGALFMGFGKRRQELVLFEESSNETRDILSDYSIKLLDEIITIVAASTIMAYSLYTFSAPDLPENHAMMMTIPFVMYGVFRYLYVIHIQGNGGDPSEVVLQDRPLQAVFLLWALIAVMILYWNTFTAWF